MKKILSILFLFLMVFYSKEGLSNTSFNFKSAHKVCRLNGYFLSLEDSTHKLTFEEIQKNKFFKPIRTTVVNLGISSSTFWVKFKVHNSTNEENLLLEIENPNLDFIELYSTNENGIIQKKVLGQSFAFNKRFFEVPTFIFDIQIKNKKAKTFYLKIRSYEQILVPITIGASKPLFQSLRKKDLIMGLYIGAVGIMIFYNLFLFLITRDKSYFLYVAYIFFVCLTHVSLLGYSFEFLWPQLPWINNHSVTISSCICCIFALLFIMNFLQTKKALPVHHVILKGSAFIFYLIIIFSLFKFYNFSFNAMRINSIFGSFFALYVGVILFQREFKSAKFFLWGWTIFLLSCIIYSLTEMGLLAFGPLSMYLIPGGSIIEAAFLSFALADRITLLQKDNKLKQDKIIQQLSENEKYLIAWREAAINAERLKKENVMTQLEAFKSQINPHFLFNSLSVLTELMYQDQDLAAEFIKELSQVYRYILENKNKLIVDLKTEIEFIEAFIFLLQIRFQESLKINIEVSNSTITLIAPLTLQLLIENAIKHNIVSKENPLLINVFIENEYIVVKNNCSKKEFHYPSFGIGLKNIKERYKLLDQEVLIFNEDNNFIVMIPFIFEKDLKSVVE